MLTASTEYSLHAKITSRQLMARLYGRECDDLLRGALQPDRCRHQGRQGFAAPARRRHDGRADVALVVVQVTPPDSDCRDLDVVIERLGGRWLSRHKDDSSYFSGGRGHRLPLASVDSTGRLRGNRRSGTKTRPALYIFVRSPDRRLPCGGPPTLGNCNLRTAKQAERPPTWGRRSPENGGRASSHSGGQL